MVAMPGFPWPNGRRAAVALTFDVDGDTVPFLVDREHAARRLSLWSEHAYGPTVGLGHILDLFDLYEVKGTFFFPGFVAERHPDAIERLLAEGHEVGHHGYMHERPDSLDDALEEEVLVRGIDALRRISGAAPKGYRSPSWELKPTTPALLRRLGFGYDSSLMAHDVPYLVETPGQNLVELPITWISDDYMQFGRSAGMGSPQAAFEVFSQEFEGLYQRGGVWIMTMHPFLTGRPSRLLLLERLIRFVRSFPRVWWTTCGELSEYCEQPGVAAAMTVEPPIIPRPNFVR
jgi:peptidoglycan-N-acetylglucosamine deacetylase